MALRLDPAKMAYAAELYASGKTFQQVASELGMDSESLRVALKRRGVKARPNSYRSAESFVPCPDGLVDAYLAGTSELVLSKTHGVSRGMVARWLREKNITRRTPKVANALTAASLTPGERAAKAAAAHAAVRGTTNSERHQARIALARERVCYGGSPSAGTEYLAQELAARNIAFVREKAIGRYNVDIALGTRPVAVEVLGGNWHGCKPVHAKRTPYILNAGWSILFIWNQQLVPLDSGALDYLLSYVEFACGNPRFPCEYRVIRGDGQLVSVGSLDDDDFPLVPPSQRKLG